MDTQFSEEELLVRREARQLGSDQAPISGLLSRTEADDNRLVELAWSAGWMGGGLSPVVRTILLYEAGRSLFPAPVHAWLRARLVLDSLGEHGLGLPLPDTAKPAIVVAAPDGGRAPLRLSRDGDALSVQGNAGFVQEVTESDHLVLLAHDDATGDPAVAVVATGDVSTVRPLRTPAGSIAGLECNAAPVTNVVFGHDAEQLFLSAVAVADIADLAGAMRAMLDLAVAHAGSRMQFGRLIGSFQAMQHRLADAALAADGAELWAFRLASMLGSRVPPAYFVRTGYHWVRAQADAVESAAHQVTAGVGYTTEHPLHRFHGRLKARMHAHQRVIDAWAGKPAASMLRGGARAQHLFDLAG